MRARELFGALWRSLWIAALAVVVLATARRPVEPWEDCPCLHGAPPCDGCRRAASAVERGEAPRWDSWCRSCADVEGLWTHAGRP